MAQKTTKTARKDAASASETKVMGLTGWTGINIVDTAPGWDALADDQFNNANLSNKYFVIQNNIDTTSSKDVECRNDILTLAEAPSGTEFTDVCCLHESILFCAFSDETIRVHDIMDADPASWITLEVIDKDGSEAISNRWTCIGFYEEMLICLRQDPEIYVGNFDATNDLGHKYCSSVSSALTVPNPHTAPTLSAQGLLQEVSSDYVCRIGITYAYSNKFGSTLDFGSDPQADWPTICVDTGPVEFSSAKYIKISGNIAQDLGDNWRDYEITGVDIYEIEDEATDAIFIGHVDIADDGSWYYNWLGSLADTSVWTDVSLTIPNQNTTKGVKACYFNVHDGRLYFWGGEDKSRLYIGGNPGNELSIATGVGGAFVDIEPGSGIEIKGTAKFKTYNGASIVTIMCGNPNSGRVKRFNLLENNLTLTTEVSSKSYSTEEVANVVGSNSIYGFGSFFDGLYTVDRYGLLVTTAAMESNNQLRVNNMSEPISSIFTDIIANRLSNVHLLYINGMIYICMAKENSDELDNLILCYDTESKAWWTYTYTESDSSIIHLANIDFVDHIEGIGIFTKNRLDLFPTTYDQPPTAPAFETHLETAELAAKMPIQGSTYFDQVEFKFDYLVGECDISIEGVDYYGRHQTITKHISESKVVYRYPVYMKICHIMESWNIKIKGKVRYRLTHILFKLYQQSANINLVYGYDVSSSYHTRSGRDKYVHHKIKSYNNLREALVT